MALPDSIKQVTGTAIVLADTTDHAPAAANNIGTRTDQIDLTSLGNSAYRQSDKFDFGVNRAPLWYCKVALEFDVAPTDLTTCDIYMAYSASATAATGNAGNASGADSAWDGYSTNGDSTVHQLDFIGSHVCTVQLAPTAQVSIIGVFVPRERHGCLIIHNGSGQAMEGNATEMSILLSPIEEQIQD